MAKDLSTSSGVSYPKKAFILAPHRQSGVDPAAQMGGLSLLERAVLNLCQAGIEQIGVVTDSEDVAAIEFSKVPSEADVRSYSIEDIEQMSMESTVGDEESDAPVVVTDVRTVLGQKTAGYFVQCAAKAGGTDLIAVDDPSGVGANQKKLDLDEHTTERLERQSPGTIPMGIASVPIRNIRKELFVGENGIKDFAGFVDELSRDDQLETVSTKRAHFYHVRQPDDLRRARTQLRRSLKKPTDGPVSKYLNRPLSSRLSAVLSEYGVTPNGITTFTLLFTFIGIGLAAYGGYWGLVWGGIIFQIASVIDGCDGEIARLSFEHTKYGAWYDTLSDNLRYTLFWAATGVAAYYQTESVIYLWSVPTFVAISFYFCGSMAQYVWQTQDHLTNLAVTAKVEEKADTDRDWWDRFIMPLRGLIKQDVQALAVMFLCFMNVPSLMFWLGVTGVVAMTISVERTLAQEAASGGMFWPTRTFQKSSSGSGG